MKFHKCTTIKTDILLRTLTSLYLTHCSLDAIVLGQHLHLLSGRSSDNYPRSISQEIHLISITEIRLKSNYLKFHLYLSGAQRAPPQICLPDEWPKSHFTKPDSMEISCCFHPNADGIICTKFRTSHNHNIFKNFLLNKKYCIVIHFFSKRFCPWGTN